MATFDRKHHQHHDHHNPYRIHNFQQQQPQQQHDHSERHSQLSLAGAHSLGQQIQSMKAANTRDTDSTHTVALTKGRSFASFDESGENSSFRMKIENPRASQQNQMIDLFLSQSVAAQQDQCSSAQTHQTDLSLGLNCDAAANHGRLTVANHIHQPQANCNTISRQQHFESDLTPLVMNFASNLLCEPIN